MIDMLNDIRAFNTENNTMYGYERKQCTEERKIE